MWRENKRVPSTGVVCRSFLRWELLGIYVRMYRVSRRSSREKRRAQAPAARVTQPSTVQLRRIFLVPMFDFAKLPRSTIKTEYRDLRRRQVQRRSPNGVDDQIGQ